MGSSKIDRAECVTDGSSAAEVEFGLRPVVHGHLVQFGGEQTGVGDGGETDCGDLNGVRAGGGPAR